MRPKQTTEDFIRKATSKHGSKYSYAKSEYKGAHAFVTITCPIHGDFKQRAGDHSNVGKGCKLCGVGLSSPPAMTTEEFIARARERHGGYYDYSKVVYETYKRCVTITCPKHGDFNQVSGKHLRGNGCPACRTGTLTTLYTAKTVEERCSEWKEKAAEAHNNFYDYSKVVFERSKNLVEIVCPVHGPFHQSPCNHLNSRCLCPSCATLNKGTALRKPTAGWLEDFRKAHGDIYDYSRCGAVTHNQQWVKIGCSKHGEFLQQAVVHAGKHGCPKCAGAESTPELELYAWITAELPGVEIRRRVRSVIPPLELDFYIPSLGIAVEFNGTYWHCDELKEKLYHQRKSLLCAEKGVLLLHVYEYDWKLRPDACKQLLRGKFGVGVETLNARALTVAPTGPELEFLRSNHFQGAVNSQICYGLYSEDTLVSLMTFGKPRYGGGYTWELLRFCSLRGVRVRGGASRLFTRFVRDHLKAGETVVSYARMDYSNGGVYKALGMLRDGICEPDYVWVRQPNTVLKRYSTQKHRLKGLLGDKFDPSKSESENMRASHYKRVYSAGNFRYVYRRDDY